MATHKKILSVPQMHCAACEYYLEKKVVGVGGIQGANANVRDKTLTIEWDHEDDTGEMIAKINEIIQKDGYTAEPQSIRRQSFWTRDLATALVICLPLVVLFSWLQSSGILETLSPQTVSYPAFFLIGVLASVSSCMVVTGGFILTFSTAMARSPGGHKARGLVALHIARIIGFFVLGGLLGLLGSAVAFSTTTTAVITILLAGVMILTALSLLGITLFAAHPLQKKIQNTVDILSQKGSVAVGVAIGVLTFFLPCGFTQSMQLYAVSTGSFISGALVMLFFALGTLPVLALMSFFSVHIQNSRYSGVLAKCAGLLILAFAATNGVAALRLLGIF
jgi:uncharacterized protein